MNWELKKITQDIQNKSMVWTAMKVETLLRNDSNDRVKSYFLKNRDMFNEMAFLLNEGYLSCSVKKYRIRDGSSYLSFKEFSSRIENLDEQVLRQIRETSRYSQEILMKYSAWKVLSNGTDSKNYSFKKSKNVSFLSEDLQVVVKSGSVNLKYLLTQFNEGLSKFIILPYFSGDVGHMFTIKSNKKFESYIKNKRAEQIEIKNFFLQTKKPKLQKCYIETVEYGTLNIHELIEFKVNEKVLRGIFLSSLEVKNGAKQAEKLFKSEQHMYQKEAESNETEIEKRLNIKRKPAPLKKMYSNDNFKEFSYFIKHPKKTTTGAIYEYYVVKPQDVLSKVSLSPDSIINTIKAIFQNTEDNTLELAFDIENENSPTNASYNPLEHKITVNISNLYNLAANRFIHEGLTPIETTQMLLSHELGHADKKALTRYNEDYYQTVEKINFNTPYINHYWSELVGFNLEGVDLNKAEKLLFILQEQIVLLEKFKNIELGCERDAFLYGKNYLPTELHYPFEQENFKTFLNYKKENELRILDIRQKYYKISSLLSTVKKGISS